MATLTNGTFTATCPRGIGWHISDKTTATIAILWLDDGMLDFKTEMGGFNYTDLPALHDICQKIVEHVKNEKI